MAAPQTPPLTERIVAELAAGPIVDRPSGRAGGILARRLGAEPKPVADALHRLDRAGRIARDLNGRRCYEIRLTGDGAVVPAPRPALRVVPPVSLPDPPQRQAAAAGSDPPWDELPWITGWQAVAAGLTALAPVLVVRLVRRGRS
jgi:hypothetical protein